MSRENALREKVVAAIKTVYDPEIPVDLWELGLIYRLELDEDGRVEIDMTLTSPACPVAERLPGQLREAVAAVEGVRDVEVKLVWDPPWDRGRMSQAALLELGFF